MHVWSLLLSRHQQRSVGERIATGHYLRHSFFSPFCSAAASCCFWGERQVKAGAFWPARLALWVTVALGHRLSHAPGFRIRHPLENAHSLQRLLRLDLLCHHDASCSARDCRACLCSCMSAFCRATERPRAHRITVTATVSLYWHLWMLFGSLSSSSFTSSLTSRRHLMATESRVPVPPISHRELWFGFAASAASWVSLGCLDILITWRACMHQENFGIPSAHPGVRILFGIVALVLLLVTIAAGLTSYRNWRALSAAATFSTPKQSSAANSWHYLVLSSASRSAWELSGSRCLRCFSISAGGRDECPPPGDARSRHASHAGRLQ